MYDARRMLESKTKLLIVDDMPLNRAILQELFQDHFEIIEAENGQQALDKLALCGSSLAAILLDVLMPVMDGLTFLEHVQISPETVPIILISTDTNADTIRRGYDLGAADFISKPFVPDVVLKRVSNIIEQYAYRQNLELLLEQQARRLRSQSDKLRFQSEEIRKSSGQMIDMLSTIVEFKNSESVSHTYNIRILTKLLLKQLMLLDSPYQIDDDTIEAVSIAAAMHDIGKIAIPDAILNKPGKLTAAEFEIMKAHTVCGCEILERLAGMNTVHYFDYCYDICRHHHERWDGGGYPDGLAGDSISIWAQAVSLADVYDALVSERVYKKPYPADVALQMILDGECGVFNPLLLQCLQILAPTLQVVLRNDNKAGIPLSLAAQAADNTSPTLPQISFDYDPSQDMLQLSTEFEAVFGLPCVFHRASTSFVRCGIFLAEDLDLILHHSLFAAKKFHHRLRLMIADGTLTWFEFIGNIAPDNTVHGILQHPHNALNASADVNTTVPARDSYTGLYTRAAFQTLVSSFLTTASCDDSFALLLITIDNADTFFQRFDYNTINQFYKETAGTLLETFFVDGWISRFSNSEFAVFLRGVYSADNLSAQLNALCESLSKAYLVGSQTLQLQAHIGVACFPEHGVTYTLLYNHAAQALQSLSANDAFAFYPTEKPSTDDAESTAAYTAYPNNLFPFCYNEPHYIRQLLAQYHTPGNGQLAWKLHRHINRACHMQEYFRKLLLHSNSLLWYAEPRHNIYYVQKNPNVLSPLPLANSYIDFYEHGYAHCRAEDRPRLVQLYRLDCIQASYSDGHPICTARYHLLTEQYGAVELIGTVCAIADADGKVTRLLGCIRVVDAAD